MQVLHITGSEGSQAAESYRFQAVQTRATRITCNRMVPKDTARYFENASDCHVAPHKTAALQKQQFC
jgi:hypothetical protein